MFTYLQFAFQLNNSLTMLIGKLFYADGFSIGRITVSTNESPFIAALPAILILPGSFLFLYLLSEFRLKTEKYHLRKNKINELRQSPYFYVYEGKELGIGDDETKNVLLKKFPYFSALDSQSQKKFIQRHKAFLRQKVFMVRSEDVYKDMFVLISAAAVQLTFGLQKYKLPHYTYLQIYREEYFADTDDLRVLAGHVFEDTITIAWNHFYEGYLIPDNGVNVGLHEMAHALYFQKVITTQIHEALQFKKRFAKLEQTTQDYCQRGVCGYYLYKSNAFRNQQEFWAESVELFFERPLDLQHSYPDIFNQVCSVLKQNPINKENPAKGFHADVTFNNETVRAFLQKVLQR